MNALNKGGKIITKTGQALYF